MKSLVSSDWLLDHLSDSNLIILDASTASNASGLKSKCEDSFIKGALKIDVSNFVDKNNPIPNTLVDAVAFESEAQKLGVCKNSKIVVYDNLGIYNSPRIWWMFKLMGHNDISVLDGGLPDWKMKGYLCEEPLSASLKKGDFVVKYQPELYRKIEAIQSNLYTKKEYIIDARSKDRFYGKAPEPRADLKSGHIPHSVNIAFASVLQNGRMKTKEELKSIFAEVVDKPLVFTCGSGTTACILMLAADQVLNNSLAIYDGSWSEWGSREDCPVA